MKGFGAKAALTFVLFLLLSLLPLIPVERSAVVLPELQNWQFTVASLPEILGLYGRLGVTYRPNSLSLIALVVLLAVSYLSAAYLFRRLPTDEKSKLSPK